MFHSTFPKLDIIADYILNHQSGRMSATSQMVQHRVKEGSIFREEPMEAYVEDSGSLAEAPLNQGPVQTVAIIR